ncbi:MAG: DUF3857 domain-containing protein [Planctomycetes bacterium]|nr:DUF3857 domain-containing protein [Planctomycetota bacterium]
MRLFALVALAACLGAALHAQDALEPLEVTAYAEKSRGRYHAALEACLTILAETRADAQDSADRARVALELGALLAHRSGATAFEPRLLELAATPGVSAHPGLRDAVLLAALERAHARGDLERTIALQRELAVLGSFLVCGPFDNERGAAFARALPAETGFDPDASFPGKKRALRWRTLPVAEAPGGRLDLDALQRPSEQVATVLACAVLAERELDAQLLLGCDGAFRVTLNGARLAERDTQRRFAWDQDRVRLPLRAGANLLVVTTMIQEGPQWLGLRLRALDGAPLAGVTTSADPATLVRAAGGTAREGATGLPADTLERLLAGAAQGEAAAALRAATLLLLTHPDEPTTRRDRELARQALATLPEAQRWIARGVYAATLWADGAAEEKDDNPRRHVYEDLLADPLSGADALETLRNLAELELSGSGNAVRAVELAERALAREPGFASARLVLADALRASRLPLLAEREVLRAAAPDERRDLAPEALLRAHDALSAAERFADAERVAERVLAFAGDAFAHERLAQLQLRRGAVEAALATLARGATLWPFATSLPARRARVLEARGEFEAAADAWREALRIRPEDDGLLVELARLAARRGDLEAQREFLRAALDLNPNRKAEARLLEFLAANEQPFHRAYELDPKAILAAHGSPPADAAAANDSHHWVLRQTVLRAYRNGTTSSYEHQIVRVLGERAVRQFARWFVPHDQGEQRARILSLRVVKTDGRELRPKLGGAVATLPPLEPGDLIDVRTRVDDISPGFFGESFGLVHAFAAADGQPIARAELVAILEPGREYRTSSTQGAPAALASTDAEGRLVWRFRLDGLPRRLDEEHAPGWRETVPIVRISTWRDWDAFAAWWWNLIRRQSELTPAIRAKVAELTKDCRDDEAKIAAIYRFVTTDVRDKAWEFGVHGYQPYDIGAIYERRHGDCKDKSILLNAMLGVAGIEAWPVLIRAEEQRDTDDLSLAMVQQFNHCISWLPATATRPARFLDGTATLHSIDTVPEMDQGATVLIVREGRAQLEPIPYVAAADNTAIDELDVELAPDGSGSARLVWHRTRNLDSPLRNFLVNEPARQKEILQRVLQPRFGSVLVEDLATSDLLDPSTPLRVELRLRAQDLASRQDGRLVLDGALEDEPLQRWTSAATRTQPLLLGVPQSVVHRVRFALPEGFAIAELPAPVELTEPFGRYALRWSREGRVLTLERERTLTTPRIEAAEYARFREFASRADAADRSTVTLEKDGTPEKDGR